MAEDLTERQRLIFDYIVRFTKQHGFPPSLQEIATNFNFSSLTGVRDHLKALVKKGHLKKSDNKARAIEVVTMPEEIEEDGIPIIGKVAAGTPILAQENIEGYVNMGNYFKSEGKIFALRVQGDSMKDEGILNGDVVIVRYQESASNGDVVVAFLNDEATVKTFYHEGQRIKLQPQNPKYQPIYVDETIESFRIGGRVIGVVRKSFSSGYSKKAS